VKSSDDLDDISAGTTNVHLTTTLKSNYDSAVSASHNRQHNIDSTSDHNGLASFTENNFLSSNASGLPKDSGKKASNFANASHSHTAGDLPTATKSALGVAKFNSNDFSVSSGNVSLDISMGSSDTDATAGSVFFAGTDGVIQQDNDNLFWNDTNNRLGIGKNNPATTLDVNGGINCDTLSMNSPSTGNAFVARDGSNRRFVRMQYDSKIYLWDDSGGMDIPNAPSNNTELLIGTTYRWIGKSGSSREIKKDIVKIRDKKSPYKNILNIDVVNFKYDPNKTKVYPECVEDVYIGMIAEDLEGQGLQEFVNYDKNGKIEGIMYHKLQFLYHEIIKDHEQEIIDLKSKNEDLEQRIKKLEEMMLKK
jgi:hypothetical protein